MNGLIPIDERSKNLPFAIGDLYDKDSTLRDFGIGYRKKTVLPISIISIILAILSYFFVLYYITIPRIRY